VKYAVDPHIASWKVVAGEAVVVHLETSYYYHLNRTGTYLWQLMAAGPHSEADLVAALADNVRRGPDQVAPDVHALLDSLLTENLVRATHGKD
jgi:hypothetical protein